MFTTWLSRIPNLHGAAVDRDQTHKVIGRAFPDWQPGSVTPFQFRVDDTTGCILVRSVEKPRWHIPGIVVIEERHPWQAGDVVQLDVHVSPTRKHGKKEIPMTPEHEVEYVLRHIAGMGLTPLESLADGEDDEVPPPDVSVRPLWVDFSTNTRVPLRPRQVRACCVVEDVGLLQKAIAEGAGGKKNFLGFGMPLVYPADYVL